jgi:biopolymer transport protein ExbB
MRLVIFTVCLLAVFFSPVAAAADGPVADIASFVEIGGPVVLVLLAMSVLALTLVLAKLIQFRRGHVGATAPAREALALCRAGRADEAIARAAASRNPTAQALARALRGQRLALAEPVVREEVLRYGSNVLFELRRGLRPLEVIGSLAPLLGLLGTVLGMIEAFRQLEAAGNQVNPAILSGGIWEALLTTAVGLTVAIPVVAMLNWLERRVDHLAHEMDDVVTQAFTVDLGEAAPASRPAAAPKNTEDMVHAASLATRHA